MLFLFPATPHSFCLGNSMPPHISPSPPHLIRISHPSEVPSSCMGTPPINFVAPCTVITASTPLSLLLHSSVDCNPDEGRCCVYLGPTAPQHLAQRLTH